MSGTTHITIEHVVVASNRSYEQVKASLEARLGMAEDLDEPRRSVSLCADYLDRAAGRVEAGGAGG